MRTSPQSLENRHKVCNLRVLVRSTREALEHEYRVCVRRRLCEKVRHLTKHENETDGIRRDWDSPVGIRPLGFARWVSPVRFRPVGFRLAGIRPGWDAPGLGFARIGIRPGWGSHGLGFAWVWDLHRSHPIVAQQI